ncbi:hypothetical protein AJ79_00111 [Helicocarpus griseus UAMH5409]|uniref:F-box domain-containing protein n=1 Tax=Helicocarpus griseus UAMH5409 TaxID=1447875 RepID=A0A2B7YEN6_9EURO|nr:hypothetical protein AJ79_00111 [Helicocarpus griseus UAMH5409]
MSQSITIRDLPAEILHIIAQNLDAFGLIRLRRTCRDFRESIPSPTHRELIDAERTEFGFQNDLYACRDCLKLRPRAKFGDNMVKKKKAKFGYDAVNRWCVDCGINPRPGTNRYTAGNHIRILGETLVICMRCRKLRAAVLEEGTWLHDCQTCRYARATEERDAYERARREMIQLRVEQAERRARRRELWGSVPDSDTLLPPSPTSSELFLEMLQAEFSHDWADQL